MALIVVAHMESHHYAIGGLVVLPWLAALVGGPLLLVQAFWEGSWSPIGIPLHRLGLLVATLLISVLITSWQTSESRARGDAIADALQSYRAAHGHWPATLAELRPPHLPRDVPRTTALGALSTTWFHYHVYADGRDYSLSFPKDGLDWETRGASGPWHRD